MKIGLDAKRAFLNRAGLGNYSRVLIQGLQQQFPGYPLYLFSARENDELKQLISTPYNRIHPEGRFMNWFPSLWRTFGIPTLAEKHGLDIYHGLSSEIPVLFAKRKTKYVVTIQDVLFLHSPEQFPAADRAIYFQKVKYAVTHADAIITNSEVVRRDLYRYFQPKAPVHVIYQCADAVYQHKHSAAELQALRARYQLSAPFILQVSSFYPRKNHQLSLRGFALIAGNIPHHLVFVGREGKEIASLRAEAEQLKISDRIHFLTAVPLLELPALYQAASLSVFPSVSEGLGIPVLESMVSGTPVITLSGTAMQEQAGDAAACLQRPDDAHEMARLMMDIVSDPAKQQAMREAGLKQSALFTQQRYINEIVQVYHSVC